MKFLYLFLIITLSSFCKVQQTQGTDLLQNLEPFVGTWEHEDGNEVFRVIIWKDNHYLKGHVQKVEIITDNENITETVVYKSEWCVQDPEFCIRHIIFGGSSDGVLLHSQIQDNTINSGQGNAQRKKKRGNMTLTIQQSNCTSCPITAEWKVKAHTGIRLDTEPLNFNIPTEIILTKVE